MDKFFLGLKVFLNILKMIEILLSIIEEKMFILYVLELNGIVLK